VISNSRRAAVLMPAEHSIAREFARRQQDGIAVFAIDLILKEKVRSQPFGSRWIDVSVLILEGETAKIDTLISRIREGIEKLKEYNSALISAAVTGKIDVRETIGNQAEHL